MQSKIFSSENLSELYMPNQNSKKGENGQVTIIGGSELFHGAPILALKSASRIVDLVFFAASDYNKDVAALLKSQLSSFIWVDFKDIDEYIKKSDSILIGPGFMRDVAFTKNITTELLEKYPDKKWVIDAGSLQMMEPTSIPRNSILTPNLREFKHLFKIAIESEVVEDYIPLVQEKAQTYGCTIALKMYKTIVSDANETYIIEDGSAGLTKGGVGDVQSGLTVALYAKNSPLLAASASSYLIKQAAKLLEAEKGLMYNTDDLADYVPIAFKKFLTK